MTVDKIETYTETVFNNFAVDKIMKKKRGISEKEAEDILRSFYDNTNIFEKECTNNNGYSSIRHGIVSKINKL